MELNKKVLFIAYDFYGYEIEVLNELKKRYDVTFINTTPTLIQLNLLRIVKIFSKPLSEKMLEKFNLMTLKNKAKGDNYDILFVLGHLDLPESFMRNLNENYKIKRRILYIWDTIKRMKNYNNWIKNFNEVYSFDMKESEENNFIYRPTFYSKRLEKNKCKHKYEILFIGAYSKERYLFLKEKILPHFSKYYIYLYWNFKNYIKNILKLDLGMVFPLKIKKNIYNKKMYRSQIIIDLLQFEQVGVTQRVLDALYLEKKIITDNKEISQYEFFNKNNILIVDSKIQKSDVEKFKKVKYIKINEEIIEYYSLEKWVEDIFDEVKK